MWLCMFVCRARCVWHAVWSCSGQTECCQTGLYSVSVINVICSMLMSKIVWKFTINCSAVDMLGMKTALSRWSLVFCIILTGLHQMLLPTFSMVFCLFQCYSALLFFVFLTFSQTSIHWLFYKIFFNIVPLLVLLLIFCHLTAADEFFQWLFRPSYVARVLYWR